MDDRKQEPEATREGALPPYEPPVVEELDSSFGPTVTAAGIPSGQLAAPREP
jgi:hypothetical protein